MTLSVSRDSGRGFLSSKPARDDRTTRRPANPVELHTPLDQSARRRAGGTDAPVRVRVFHRRLRRIRSRSSLPYPHMVAFRTGQTGRCASCRRKRGERHTMLKPDCSFFLLPEHRKSVPILIIRFFSENPLASGEIRKRQTSKKTPAARSLYRFTLFSVGDAYYNKSPQRSRCQPDP